MCSWTPSQRKRPRILLRSGWYAEGEASFSHRVNHKASEGDLPHILLLSGTADRLAQWVCWQKADLASLILWDELSCKLLYKWKKTLTSFPFQKIYINSQTAGNLSCHCFNAATIWKPIDHEWLTKFYKDLGCQTSAFNAIFSHTVVNCVWIEKTSSHLGLWTPIIDIFFWYLTL